MRTGIALGSNLGDRLENLREAVANLQMLAVPGGEFLVSHAYETTPVDCPPESPVFLNAVAEIEYQGEIFKLLESLQAFEQAKGRPSRRPKNAPRPIDLDILYCDNMTLDDPRLILPHPRISNRRFVLEPLAEIRPTLTLPGWKENVLTLLGRMDADLDKNNIHKILLLNN